MNTFSRLRGIVLGRVAVWRPLVLGCAVALAGGVWPAAGLADTAAVTNPAPRVPESIAAGRAVFEKNCLVCHGTDGKGVEVGEYATRPADLTRDKFDHGSSDADIYSTIKDGVGPDFFMDAWGGRISEPDLWNLVNYIRTLQKK